MRATSEVISLYDLNDKKIDEVELPVGMPQTNPRSIRHLGRTFVEGGGPDSFYGFGQFAEVPKSDA